MIYLLLWKFGKNMNVMWKTNPICTLCVWACEYFHRGWRHSWIQRARGLKPIGFRYRNIYVCPSLDQIRNYLIYIAIITKCMSCYFKFQNRCWDTKGAGGQSEDSLQLCIFNIGPPPHLYSIYISLLEKMCPPQQKSNTKQVRDYVVSVALWGSFL